MICNSSIAGGKPLDHNHVYQDVVELLSHGESDIFTLIALFIFIMLFVLL